MPLLNPTTPPRVSRVMADINDEVFNYFFDPDNPSVFTKTRGARQALIAQFFHRLYIECVREGIPPQWEPDNESRVQEIMNQLNFQ